MGESTEKIVWDGESAGAIAAYRAVVQADKELLAQVQKTLATAEKGSKEWQQAKLKEMQLLRQVANDVKNVEAAQDRANRKTKESGEAWTGFAKTGGNALNAIGISLTAGTIVQGLLKIIDLQKEWNKEILNTVREQDKVGRKLQVQALLDDKEFQRILTERIAPISMATARPLPQVQAAATELISQGFTTEEATGPALQELLLGAAAQNVEDEKAFASAIASFIKSQGKQLTAENVRAVTAPMTSLFQGTPFQGADLQAISKIGALLKQFNVSQTDIFSAVNIAKEATGAPGEAAVAVRNIVGKLGAAKATPESLGILEQIGGAGFAERVDLVGETLPQALQNLKDALDGLDESSRNAALAKLFGAESVAGAAQLLSNIHKFRELAEVQRDTTKFQRGVEIATTGPVASEVRGATQKTMATLAQERQQALIEELLGAAETEMIERGVGPVRRKLKLSVLRTHFAARDLFGKEQRPEELLQGIEDLDPAVGARMRELIEARRRPAELPSLDMPLPPESPAPVSTPTTGPKRSIDFTKDTSAGQVKSADELALEGMRIDLKSLEAARQQREMEETASGIARDPREKNLLTDRLDREIKQKRLEISQQEIRVDAAKLRGEEEKAGIRPERPDDRSIPGRFDVLPPRDEQETRAQPGRFDFLPARPVRGESGGPVINVQTPAPDLSALVAPLEQLASLTEQLIAVSREKQHRTVLRNGQLS